MGAAIFVDELFGKCPQGLEKSGGLCYPPCPPGFKGSGPTCWEECPPNTTDFGVGCTKKSFLDDRKDPICSSDKEKDAGLCYPLCREGYKGILTVCWPECPSGFKDTGLTCLRPTYGRGGGWPLTEKSKCEKQAREEKYKSVGTCDTCSGLYFPTCAEGYRHTTCNFCAGECPSDGFRETDVDCEKVTYDRGAGTAPTSCEAGYTYRDSLGACYKDCPTGFQFQEGTCYAQCGEGWKGGQTLTSCTKSSKGRGAGVPPKIDYFWVWIIVGIIVGALILYILFKFLKGGSKVIEANPELLA